MKKLFILTIVALSISSPALAKRGCCSHHGGVSHCGDNGYYICNDGKQSPSCTCDSSFSEPEQQTYVPSIKALFSQRSDSPFLLNMLLAGQSKEMISGKVTF